MGYQAQKKDNREINGLILAYQAPELPEFVENNQRLLKNNRK